MHRLGQPKFNELVEALATYLPFISSDAVSYGSESDDGSDLKLLLFSSAYITSNCRNRRGSLPQPPTCSLQANPGGGQAEGSPTETSLVPRLENAMRAAADVLLMSPAPKEECALEIIKGGTLRQREVYYRYASTKLPLLLRDWAAELLDLLVRQRYRPERLRAA